MFLKLIIKHLATLVALQLTNSYRHKVSLKLYNVVGDAIYVIIFNITSRCGQYLIKVVV